MANLDAGVFQGMPVSTSRSASSLNESSGTKAPLASFATGTLVMATLVVPAVLAVLRADVAHLAHTQ